MTAVLKEIMGAVRTERFSPKPYTVKCEVCGGTNLCFLEYPSTRTLFFANMTLVSCFGCGVSYVPTRPKGLEYYYEQVYSLDKGRESTVSPDEMFSGRHDKYLAPERSADHIALLRKHFGEFDSVVDVGAGYGMSLRTSGAKRKIAIEVDASMKPYLEYVGAEIHPSLSGLEEGSVDVTLSSHYLEHLYISDVFENVKEMLRVMRKDGVGLIEVPNAPLLYLDFRKSKHSGHVVFFSVQSMVAVIEACGGRIVEHAGRGDPMALRNKVRFTPTLGFDYTETRFVCVFRRA